VRGDPACGGPATASGPPLATMRVTTVPGPVVIRNVVPADGVGRFVCCGRSRGRIPRRAERALSAEVRCQAEAGRAAGGASDAPALNPAPRIEDLSGHFATVPGQCGALVGVGGRPVCLDAVSRAEVFVELWPRLLDGYAADALGAPTGPPLRRRDLVGLLRALGTVPLSQIPSVGLGSDVRGATRDLELTGLVHEGELIQMSAYARADEESGLCSFCLSSLSRQRAPASRVWPSRSEPSRGATCAMTSAGWTRTMTDRCRDLAMHYVSFFADSPDEPPPPEVGSPGTVGTRRWRAERGFAHQARRTMTPTRSAGVAPTTSLPPRPTTPRSTRSTATT
jgi:hypothetical protein